MWQRKIILMYLVQKINCGVLTKYGPIDSRKSLQRFGSDVTLNLFSPPLTCDRNTRDNFFDSPGQFDSIMVHFYDSAQDYSVTYSIIHAAAKILDTLGWNPKSYERIFTSTWVLYVPCISAPTEFVYMRKAFMEKRQLFFIVIQYDALFGDTASYRERYEATVKYLNDIARAINDFLKEFYERKIYRTHIRCIGHGLGAQIIGAVGFLYHETTGNYLARITALDPAGPCFHEWGHEDVVKKGAADYVEIYHCNAGGLGTTTFKGDVDFIANIKVQPFQPGCKIVEFPEYQNIEEAAMCSHDKCVQFYSETVSDQMKFIAEKCRRPSYPIPNYFKDFGRNDCGSSEMIIAGFGNPGNARGLYYFSTA